VTNFVIRLCSNTHTLRSLTHSHHSLQFNQSKHLLTYALNRLLACASAPPLQTPAAEEAAQSTPHENISAEVPLASKPTASVAVNVAPPKRASAVPTPKPASAVVPSAPSASKGTFNPFSKTKSGAEGGSSGSQHAGRADTASTTSTTTTTTTAAAKTSTNDTAATGGGGTQSGGGQGGAAATFNPFGKKKAAGDASQGGGDGAAGFNPFGGQHKRTAAARLTILSQKRVQVPPPPAQLSAPLFFCSHLR
jgi:type IV secretory pathway VirB10-like protein